MLVPTMLQRLVGLQPGTKSEYGTGSLRVIFCAGSALSPDQARSTTEEDDAIYNLYCRPFR